MSIGTNLPPIASETLIIQGGSIGGTMSISALLPPVAAGLGMYLFHKGMTEVKKEYFLASASVFGVAVGADIARTQAAVRGASNLLGIFARAVGWPIGIGICFSVGMFVTVAAKGFNYGRGDALIPMIVILLGTGVATGVVAGVVAVALTIFKAV